MRRRKILDHNIFHFYSLSRSTCCRPRDDVTSPVIEPKRSRPSRLGKEESRFQGIDTETSVFDRRRRRRNNEVSLEVYSVICTTEGSQCVDDVGRYGVEILIVTSISDYILTQMFSSKKTSDTCRSISDFIESSLVVSLEIKVEHDVSIGCTVRSSLLASTPAGYTAWSSRNRKSRSRSVLKVIDVNRSDQTYTNGTAYATDIYHDPFAIHPSTWSANLHNGYGTETVRFSFWTVQSNYCAFEMTHVTTASSRKFHWSSTFDFGEKRDNVSSVV